MEINRSRYKMIKIWNTKRKIYKKNLFFLKKKTPRNLQIFNRYSIYYNKNRIREK